MNPFVYPKIKHSRTETPPVYKNYSTYKQFLRREFKGKCVYCLTPDTLKGEAAFGADHYRPKNLFPHLATEYCNLFYCCNQCNSRKGKFSPLSLKANSKFIPNPCDHVMYQHLKFNRENVVYKSVAGEFTAELLDLNDPKTVEYRANVIHLIDTLMEKIGECEKLKERFLDKFNSGKINQYAYDQVLLKITVEFDRSKSALRQLCGEF